MEPSRPAATPLKAGAGSTVAGGGEPPYDGSMEHRITTLEARWDAVIPTLATKTDLAELGAQLRAEFRDGLHSNSMAISALRTEMQQSFGEIRADLQKLSADNKTWMLATVLTIVGTVLAAIIGISQIQKTMPPAPIVITLPAPK